MILDFSPPAQNLSINTLCLFEIVEVFPENPFQLRVDDQIFGFTCFQLDNIRGMWWEASIMW